MNGEGKKRGFSQLSVLGKVLGIVMIAVTLSAACVSFYQYSRYAIQVYMILGCIAGAAAVALLVLLICGNLIFQSRPALCIGCILAVILSVLTFPSTKWPFSSKEPEQYGKQMSYLSEKKSMPLFFPEELPSEVFNYEIRFDPGYFGHDAYFLVSFRCNGQALSEYRKIARKQSVLSLMELKEVRDNNLSDQHKAQMAELFGVNVEDLVRYPLKIELPSDIDDHPNSRVYIMSCDYNDGDLQTEAILIDVAGGWVCFTRLF